MSMTIFQKPDAELPLNQIPKNKLTILEKESDVSLFPLFIGGYSMTNTIEKYVGINYNFFALYFRNKEMWYLADIGPYKDFVKSFVDKILINPNLFFEIKNKTLSEGGNKIEALHKEIKSIDLNKLRNEQLFGIYKRFTEINLELYNLGLSIVTLDFHYYQPLTESIREELKTKLNNEEQVNESYISLTTSPEKTSLKKSLDEIQKIVEYIKDNKIKNIEDNEKVKEMVKSYLRNYCWINYLYEGPPASYDYVLELLKINLDKEKIKECSKPKVHVNLSKKNIKYCEILREAAYLKQERKFIQTKGYYYIEPVLLELANRLNIKLESIRWLLPYEIEESLNSKKDYSNEIKRRKEYCLYIAISDKQVLIDDKAKVIFFREKYVDIPKKERVDLLKGSVACIGETVVGKVKIINRKEDIKKMNKGDVLVSRTTNPDLVLAMEKAAAIITDLGGLTSHAAIVSREMNIPCIVGTENATEFLKDGDKVEVNTKIGYIRKL